jgi:hypothetical protein
MVMFNKCVLKNLQDLQTDKHNVRGPFTLQKIISPENELQSITQKVLYTLPPLVWHHDT